MKMSYLSAIVTGASRGIGFHIAKYLAGKGYQLLLIAQNEEALQKAAEEINLVNTEIPYPKIAAFDVVSYEQAKISVENFIKHTNGIDLLCNNAGYVKRGTSDLKPEEFIKMINTNLIGAYNFIYLVSPHMKKAGKGRIINIASHSGKVAKKQAGGYSSSKYGIIGFNEALYKELSHFGIYVTAICPNWVATDMTADINVDKNEMMQVSDVVNTLDYLLHLSPSVAIKEIVMQCRLTLLAE